MIISEVKNFNPLIFILGLIFIPMNFSIGQTDLQVLRALSSNNAGSLNVAIGGNFIVTGSFTAQLNERLDQFITRIYNEAKVSVYQTAKNEIMLTEIEKKLTDYGLRGIKLKRNNGETLSIDLFMFRLNGDYVNNPYLKNDDVIIFPPVDMERNYFMVEGAVNSPGKYQFIDGDDLSLALKLSNGVHPAYDNVSEAEVLRLDYTGNQMTKFKIKLDENFELKRGDRIRVLSDETNRKAFSALVLGEVNSPGKIAITKNSTTLSEVVQSAGGFTADANQKNIYVFKASVFPPGFFEKFFNQEVGKPKYLFDREIFDYYENIDEFRMYRMSNLEDIDTTYFFGETRYRSLFNSRRFDLSEQNTNLEDGGFIINDGDVIIIRQKENTILVFGQVANPGPVIFKPGEPISYYINKAGGKTEFSREDISVIKANTREWISVTPKNQPVLEAGDYIWIPREPIRSFDYYVWRFGNYIGIAGSVATIVLLLFQLTK